MAANNQQGSAPPTSRPASSRNTSRTRTPISRAGTPGSDGDLASVGAIFNDHAYEIVAPEHGIEVPARVRKRVSDAERMADLSQTSGADANAEQVAGSDTASVHTTRQGASTVSLRTTTPSSSEAGDGAAAETPMPKASTTELPNRSKPNPIDNKRKASASETDSDVAHKKTTPTKTRFD